MMGAPVGRQDRLSYEFHLEDMVPADHLLRRIDGVLDLSWLRGEMKAHYSHLGCPSVCPELMVRMLLIGYLYSTRSEWRLCQEVRVSLAYRWFCGLGQEDISLVESVQRGLASLGYGQGRYVADPASSWCSESALHQFHRQILNALEDGNWYSNTLNLISVN